MKGLIFVGGLQYSGKSHFCRDLAAKYPDRYAHLEADSILEKLHAEPSAFHDLMRRYDERFHYHLVQLAISNGLNDKGAQLAFFTQVANQHPKLREGYENIINECVIAYMAELLLAAMPGQIPLVDGLFTAKTTRKATYGLIANWVQGKIDLDSVNKMMLYFDLGLKISLERYRAQKRDSSKALQWDESLIRRTHANQEVPTENELPNCKIEIVRNAISLEARINTYFSF